MSSYVKALEGVMRLFPKKIKVTYIHAISGELIGIEKMFAEQLPEKFKRPTTIKAFDKEWRVLKADPRKSIDFLSTKKLTLHVYEADFTDPSNTHHFYPTAAYWIPNSSGHNLFSEFKFKLSKEAWRQIEFLPFGSMPAIQPEIDLVIAVLKSGNSPDMLMGYERMHIRENIGEHNIYIPVNKFCELIKISEKGALSFSGEESGYVENGFVLRSENHTYYGTMKGEHITNLCLENFDCADDEIFEILAGFDLVMVDWCRAKILTGEVSDVTGDLNPLEQQQQGDGLM